MCTVTVVPWAGQVRLAANRDELRSRPAALPPEVRRFGRRQALLPLDPLGGGTWVAVNDAAVAMTILNVTATMPGKRHAEPRRSRGAIIPALLSADTLAQASERALCLEVEEFAPFRLILVDEEELVELRSDGRHIQLVRRASATALYLFTSSGLGDGLVEAPRSRLFAEHLGAANDLAVAQDAFHRHSWPDAPHLSVCMRRPDARTVSHTVLTLDLKHISLVYHPEAPDEPAGMYALRLDRRRGGTH